MSAETPPLKQNLAELASLYDVGVGTVTGGNKRPTARLFVALEYTTTLGLVRLRRQKRGMKLLEALGAREPKTDLGKLAVQLGVLDENPSVEFGANACEAAEPRVLQSISLIEQKAPLPENKAPAKVFIDPEGVPFAFEKNSGADTTVLLRETPLVPGVPVGVIIRPVRGRLGNRPYLGNEAFPYPTNNDQLQVVKIDRPQAACIIRPSVFSLDPELVKSINYNPSSYIKPSAKPYARALAETSLTSITERIDGFTAEASF